ncbi:MAG: hypothetical protein WB973_22660 [Thermoanaerobaculia bacterium]
MLPKGDDTGLRAATLASADDFRVWSGHELRLAYVGRVVPPTISHHLLPEE